MLRTLRELGALCASGGLAGLMLLMPGLVEARPLADYRALLEHIKARQQVLPRSQADVMIQAARCWADVALHERLRNESGGFAAAAHAHAQALVDRATQPGAEPELQAPAWPALPSLFERRIRPDLWRRIDALGLASGDELCRLGQRGCLEARLHEATYLEQRLGWRTAQPYIEIVEDQLADLGGPAASCPVAQPEPPAPKSAPPMAAAVEEPPAAPRRISVQIELLFDLDRDSLRPDARGRLAGLLSELQGRRLQRIVVAGHADRIAGTDYNQRLSQRRAEAVKSYLVEQGIAAAHIETTAFGNQQSVLDASACQRLPFAELVSCLQPDRRVTVTVDAQP